MENKLTINNILGIGYWIEAENVHDILIRIYMSIYEPILEDVNYIKEDVVKFINEMTETEKHNADILLKQINDDADSNMSDEEFNKKYGKYIFIFKK